MRTSRKTPLERGRNTMQRERRKNNDILFHFRKDGLPITKLSQLKIDPEFQNQINPPSFEETHQLEMNILKEERVLNPIITWNGYIVDGHDCAETSSMIAQKCTPNQRNKSNLKDSHLIRTTDAHLTFGEYQSASPLLSDLHAKIAVVISAP